MLEVETGHEMPTARNSRQYPWDTMSVGDSFFVAGATSQDMSPVISHRQRKHTEKYTRRSINGGVRVWKLA